MAKSTRYPAADWQLDQDYTDKLSESEKDFLDKFNREYYLSNKRELHDEEGIRDCWRAFKRNSKDVISRGAIPDRVNHDNLGNTLIEGVLSDASKNNATPEDLAIARVDAERAAAAKRKPTTSPIGSVLLKN